MTPKSNSRTPAQRLATLVSWIGHPLVFVTATVGAVVGTQLASRAAVSILLALFLSVILPVGVLLFLGVRSGRWKDADVSVREERKRFYPIAIPVSAVGIAATWLAGAPRYILRGGIVTFILLIVAAFINLRFKLSLHALFAAYCAVVLWQVNPVCGWIGTGLTALVLWSRLFLKRHTWPEIVAGVLLGSGGGVIASGISI